MKSHPPLSAERINEIFKNNDWVRLMRECKKVLRKKPQDLWAHRHLGFSFRRMGQNDEAVTAYAKALIYWPDDAEILLNYGQSLLETGQEFSALPMLEKARDLRPEKYLTWMKLSQALYRCQGHAKGLECAQKMRELAQGSAQQVNSLVHLSLHEREFGRVKEAIAHCTEALDIDPSEASAHTNRLLFMLADPDVDAESLKRAAEQYASAIEPNYAPFHQTHDAQDRKPDERLRIGFLSPDFRNHSVMYFMEGVLAQLDRRQFTVIGFNLHGGTDAISERVRIYVDMFIDLTNQTFQEQLKLVRAARPDILIDLAGHTGNNGLGIMACKPAPIQATWIGYPGTTGLKTIDYLITDNYTDPPGVEHLYTEQLLRLDSRLCVYRPLIRNPLYRYQPAYAVKPSPALENGFITFGSCNNLGKLTDDVLTVWAKIVNQCPGSKILIEGKGFETPNIMLSYRERCKRLGFKDEQLILDGLDARNQYLTYHRIDIALDPFPLNGGTTSMDVLWMGVPLIAMQGRSFRDRLSTGILLWLDRSQWLANNVDDYVAKACELACDINVLNDIRLSLRDEIEQNILMREDRFCHRLGLSLRKIWLNWLAKSTAPADADRQQQYLENAWASLPKEWHVQAQPEVGLAPGKRVPLNEAQIVLDQALKKAQAIDGLPKAGVEFQQYPHWSTLTNLCDTVLASVPNEPFALACLAEVEHAFGHTDFAVTYLRYAQRAIELNTKAQ